MFKIRDTLYAALFLALVLIMWVGLSFLPGPVYEYQPFETLGSYDLTGNNFDETVFRLTKQAWETWPERLYTPAELETAEYPVPASGLDYSTLPFATHRVTLHLTPGVTYGIAQRSADYAMRMFMDGEEIVCVGRPAAPANENIPQVRQIVYYFTPQSETVELVVQSSNHVHYRDGAKVPAIVIGTADCIAAYVQGNNLKAGIMFGCLMAAFLYHLAAFLLNRRQRASLLFSLQCLVMAFLTVEGFATISKGYDWFALYRLSYVGTLFLAALLVFLIDAIFPGETHRIVRLGYLSFCGVFLLVVLLAPTLFVTRILVVLHVVYVAIVGYYVVRLAQTLRHCKRLKNVLAFLGVSLYGLFTVYDILHQNSIGPAWYINNQKVIDSSAGLVLWVACYAMVLAIDQAEVNAQLERAQTELTQAEARCQALMNKQGRVQIPKDLLASLGLTQRQIEVALLLLDGKHREEVSHLMGISKGTVNFHCDNIYRKLGVGSFAEFARLISGGKICEKDEKIM